MGKRGTKFIFRGVFFAFAAAILTAAPVRAPATIIQYSALLSGAQEVPPGPSTGGGMAAVALDTLTGQMNWSVEWWGLTGPATSAHFHGPAPVGVNAGVLYPIDHNSNPSSGVANLTAGQQGYLANEEIYVNIHTAAHPGGEVRGQLRVAGSHQLSPILPNQEHSDRQRGVWVFIDAEGGGAWFDPFAATGYDFTTTDGVSNFTTVIMPIGVTPGPYTVTSVHGSTSVPAGGMYVFPAPVDKFSITDIIPGVDSSDPTAFPVFLGFDQQTVSFTMVAVPEPATVVVLALGCVFMLGGRRRGLIFKPQRIS